MTAVRHHTHPSEQCECDTCEHEYSPGGTGFEFAVNPHTETIICLHPHNGGYRIEFVQHHPCGRTATTEHHYTSWAKAAHAFWLNAEHQPPQAARS